jgi:hypothetical protein
MLDDLVEQIKKYCTLNNLDYDKTYLSILQSGFNIIKYGDKPSFINKKVKPKEDTLVKEKEVINIEPKKEKVINKEIKNELYD